MRYIRNIIFFLAAFCVFMFESCSTCSRQQRIEEVTIDLADLAIDSAHMDMARKVFYALPTPIEISVLIKNSGVSYQASLLNDVSNASKYLTNPKMAINFGVYVTDLTYAGLFEQTQTVLRYKQALQRMIEGLGMQSAIDRNLMQRLEANINDKNEMLRIISETYSSCTAYLDEDDRYFLTLAMLAGGWIEGMYLATSMTDESYALTEDRMKQLVIDQKLTFDLMWRVMSDMSNIADIADLKTQLSPLAQIYDRITIDQTPNVVTLNPNDGTSDIHASVSNNITPELYAELKKHIQTIRHNFTQK